MPLEGLKSILHATVWWRGERCGTVLTLFQRGLQRDGHVLMDGMWWLDSGLQLFNLWRIISWGGLLLGGDQTDAAQRGNSSSITLLLQLSQSVSEKKKYISELQHAEEQSRQRWNKLNSCVCFSKNYRKQSELESSTEYSRLRHPLLLPPIHTHTNTHCSVWAKSVRQGSHLLLHHYIQWIHLCKQHIKLFQICSQ